MALPTVKRPLRHTDPAEEAALLDALQKARARGATVLLVAHRKSVLSIADRLLVIDAGKPKMLGPAKDVVARLTAPAAESAA
jgi:ABC-type protease/lipase transport system fused ATPase/permease subunit